MTGKGTGGAKVTLRVGWVPTNKPGWENWAGAGAGAGTGGLGKEAKAGAGSDGGCLTYMVFMEGGRMVLAGAGLQ